MTTRTLTLAVLTFAALVAFAAVPAAADTPDYYRDAMRDLVVNADAWHAELEAELVAMSAKPQLACAESYQDLLRRGTWLAADLRGSVAAAPTLDIGASNAAAADGFDMMLYGAEFAAEACDGAELARAESMVSDGFDQYTSGSMFLRAFLGLSVNAPADHGGQPAPALPEPAFPDFG